MEFVEKVKDMEFGEEQTFVVTDGIYYDFVVNVLKLNDDSFKVDITDNLDKANCGEDTINLQELTNLLTEGYY